MGVRAVDFDLGEHRERHIVLFGAKLADCSLVPWLLMAELVAREAEHGEAAFAKAPVQRFEPCILRGEAALACDIDDQQRLFAKSPSVRASPSIVFIAMAGERDMGRESSNLPHSFDRR